MDTEIIESEKNEGVVKVKEPKKSSFLKEVVILIILVVGIVIPIKMFIAQPFIVSGTSMKPTFEDGQYLIVDRLSHLFQKPQRGEVIIFHYPDDPKKFFIKRIIGLPGETVEINNNDVRITKTDGTQITLQEEYVKYIKQSSSTLTLKDDEYFVMGDNRKDSYDSRSWGPLQEKFIIGRAFLRLLPLSEIDYIPGKNNNY